MIVFCGLLDSLADKLIASTKAAFSDANRPVGVVWLGASAHVLNQLDDAGIPVFADIPQAATAFQNVVLATEQQQRMSQLTDRTWPAPAAGISIDTDVHTLTEHQAAERVKSLCDLCLLYTSPSPRDS